MFGSIPAVRLAGSIRFGGKGRTRAATPRPATLRPAVLPETLDDLRGPVSGVVELPVRLYWSAGSRRFDLSSPHESADLYEAVIDAASSQADLIRYLNADLLRRVWPLLGMSRVKRAAWEGRFPALRGQRFNQAA